MATRSWKIAGVILGFAVTALCAVVYHNGGTREWQLWVLAGIIAAFSAVVYELVYAGKDILPAFDDPVVNDPCFRDLPCNIYYDPSEH